MYVTLTLAIALALAQPTSGGRFERTNSRTPQGRNDRGLQPSSGAWFEFAPASGKGLTSARNLCDVLKPEEKVGNWWCRDGNGLAAGSAVAVNTARGSVSASSQAVCPNGPNCAPVASMYVPAAGGDHGYTEATNVNRSASITTGSFTHCWYGQANFTTGGEMPLASLSSSGAGTWRDILIAFTSGGTLGARISTAACGGGDTVLSSGLSFVTGAPTLLCLSWSASAGIYRTYVNGVAGNTSAAYTTICGGGVNSRYTIGGYWNGSAIASSTQGHHFGAFDLPQQLSASRIAEIANAVLPRPTGAKGEALTVTRNSVQGCIPGSAGSIAPPNRLCVHSGGTTASQGSFVQRALRTEEFDNSAWITYAVGVPAPTITPNVEMSPVGTLTADRVQIPATAFGQGSFKFQGAATVEVTHTFSVWVKGNNQSGSVQLLAFGGAGWQCATCNYSANVWTRCYGPVVSMNGNIGFGNDSIFACGNPTPRDAVDVFVWGFNLTEGTTLRPYIPATSAAVTTANESVYATLPANAPALASVEATFDAPVAWSADSYLMSVWKDANNRLDAFVDTASANKLSCTFVVAGTSYTGLSASGVSTSATHRISCSYAGGNVVACVDGTCNSTAQSFTLFSGATRVYLGNSSSGASQLSPMPILKGVKADPNPYKFR